jgi:hypothetical protein
MQERSPKRLLGAVLITLALASFSFAGDIHCPLTDPPPGEEDGGRVLINNTNPPVKEDVQFLKGFWEILARGTGLF